MATFKSIAQQAPVRVSYVQTAAAGTAPDAFVFVNPTGSGEYFEVAEISYIYDVVGGASAVADIVIAASGVALASGVSCVATVPDLTATARTPRKATLSATKAALVVKPGDSIGINTGGTLTGLVGLVVQITLKPTHTRKTH